MNETKKKKVVVGLSGGVDSSVCALLLKQAGFDVIGVTMILYDKKSEDKACGSSKAVLDAKAVADKLEIPFYTLDLTKEFKELVIDYFAKEYMEGKTPNPCIACNKHLKFNLMLKKAMELYDADYIATGHYAKVLKDENTNRYYVAESVTASKDQTYVLYNMTQEELSHVLMPLGDYTKDEIREIARENGFITADKKDSQEICFVEDNDYANFITTNYNYKSM
ncbi:MAG: tRNA 2-thiouridine(34) synthase MnmA, partial [Clostridia bacterium]|nr:tRNA 2-thiouridine(34) synthase MnmA [Clostridia bacterium]